MLAFPSNYGFYHWTDVSKMTYHYCDLPFVAIVIGWQGRALPSVRPQPMMCSFRVITRKALCRGLESLRSRFRPNELVTRFFFCHRIAVDRGLCGCESKLRARWTKCLAYYDQALDPFMYAGRWNKEVPLCLKVDASMRHCILKLHGRP